MCRSVFLHLNGVDGWGTRKALWLGGSPNIATPQLRIAAGA